MIINFFNIDDNGNAYCFFEGFKVFIGTFGGRRYHINGIHNEENSVWYFDDDEFDTATEAVLEAIRRFRTELPVK